MDITFGSSTAIDLTDYAEALLVPAQFGNQQSVSNSPMRPDLTGRTAGTTEMTPGATYREGVTATDVRDALLYQDGHARAQWATGRGVVGPTGSEQDSPFARYNDPADPNFALYQQFGYHHDQQSADAQLQAGWAYDLTNKTSALRGFDVLIATRDVDRALDAARREWGSSGFVVRERY